VVRVHGVLGTGRRQADRSRPIHEVLVIDRTVGCWDYSKSFYKIFLLEFSQRACRDKLFACEIAN